MSEPSPEENGLVYGSARAVSKQHFAGFEPARNVPALERNLLPANNSGLSDRQDL